MHMIITKTEVWHVNHFIHDEGKKRKKYDLFKNDIIFP